jgi:hypothetical protein
MRVAVVAVALALGTLGLAAIFTSSASAGTAPICAQYPDLPQCSGNGGGGGGGDQSSDALGALGGDNQATAGTSEGSLPFTGYPLTALLLLFVILLAAGLAIRAYVALRDRVAGEHGDRRPPSGLA